MTIKNFIKCTGFFSGLGALKTTSAPSVALGPMTRSIAFLLICCMAGCGQNGYQKEIVVQNPLKIDRKAETISIPVTKLAALEGKYGLENLLVMEKGTAQYRVRQLIDYDQDGEADEFLFQTDIKAGEEKRFVIEGKENGASLQPESEITTYSRFVPERTDDYTWENDRVAFRTYGPEAQRLVEDGEPGGTLSSGIDLWLKRVDYSIIDKWYEKNLESVGYYHIDHGEGYDPYHVGKSRGVGGTGILSNDSLYVSKNFTAYKTIATGPIRTVFELTYAPWEGNGMTISETKRISLDLGANLSRFEITLSSEEAIQGYTLGITLHDKKGKGTANEQEGWLAYWEPMDGSALGTAIVMDPEKVKEIKDRQVDQPDQSHLLAIVKPENGKVTYYAGFGWKKSRQFDSRQEWIQYLENFAKSIQNPVTVNIK